jgi:hydrophobic/amphiphilic exporter-1 (mainly G- bacteria), HAE1 family
VQSGYTGSASKLRAVKDVLLGDGSFLGTINSSMFLALVITYLLMCVLFQSFLHPLVIMFSVPLATLGGFAALAGLHYWSINDRYIPDQKLDVLVMLGFIILIGVVVNNAILIVHQALNFMKGVSDSPGVTGALPPREAITESVRTRVRPILMSLFTSVIGMLPLVLSPGAGSELYRGLGAVVLGGLVVSTIFTLILIPLLMNLVIDAQQWLKALLLRPEQLQPSFVTVTEAPGDAGAMPASSNGSPASAPAPASHHCRRAADEPTATPE